MAKKNKETQKDAADQELIDERVNAVADKFGAADVDIEDGATAESESIIILKDSQGEEFRRGTLTELEAAEVPGPQDPPAQDGVETNTAGKPTTDGEPLENTKGDEDTAGTTNDPDRTENVVLDTTLAELKLKFNAAEVELQDGPAGTKESIIILKDDRGNIIEQGIASYLQNMVIGSPEVFNADGSQKTFTSEEVHEQGIGTAVPGANPKPPEPVKVDEKDLPKADRAQ